MLSLVLIAAFGQMSTTASTLTTTNTTVGSLYLGSSSSSTNLASLGSISLVTAVGDSFTLSTGTIRPPTPLAAITAVDPLGTLKQTLPYTVSRMILDAPRHRIYASDNINNRVLIFDTTSSTLLTTVLVGSAPYGLAMTPDGHTLYVANSGSTTAAISAVDLNTLTVSSTLASSVRLFNLVVGLNGRIYASTDGSQAAIVQIDPANPANNTSFGSFSSAQLAISPDLKTLYIGEGYYSPRLSKYDVSTTTAALLQKSSNSSYYSFDLQLSHSGTTILYFNSAPVPAITTSDLNGIGGSFNAGSNKSVSAAAFSADDSLVYTVGASYNGGVNVFSAATYTPVGSFALPDYTYSFAPTALLTDEANQFIYINTGTQIYVYATGRQAPYLPSTLAASGGKNVTFSYQIPASQYPTSYSATLLPAGLLFNSASGIIYGKPTVAGTFVVPISASNSLGTAQSSLTLTIGEALQVSVTGLGSVTPGRLGVSYPKVGDSVSITAYPAVDQQFLGWTGSVISPSNPLSFTMQADFNLQANFGPLPPTITSSLIVGISDGSYFSYQIATDHPATSFTASPLPNGISFNPATGYLSGIINTADSFDITITATNAGGSDSKTLSLAPRAPLELNTNGGGTIYGLGYYDYLNVGQSYSITAIAYSGYIFTGWTGSFPSMNSTLDFTMAKDSSLQANFLSRGELAGKFLGLITETPSPTGAAGLLSLTVNTGGAFNGYARFRGNIIPVKGRFGDDGTATLVVNGATLSLQATQIYGDLEIVGAVSIGGEEVAFSASRSSFSQQQPSDFSGPFLLSLPAADASDTTVPGDASLKVRMAQSGLVQITGKLSDGTKIAATTRLLDDFSFLVYLPLYGGKGLLSGVMAYHDADSTFQGTLTWVKPADLPAKFQKSFPAGFSTQIEATATSRSSNALAKPSSGTGSGVSVGAAASWSSPDPVAASQWTATPGRPSLSPLSAQEISAP